jgi:L-lactate dehydrogenase complex protein LldF
MSEPFADRYRAAVADDQLSGNLLAFQRGWRDGRDARFAPGAAPAEFDELRRRLVAAKDDAISRQPQLLAGFEARARERGVWVHTAATADDAVRVVLDICRSHGTDAVIKTKSMATEEIDLNHRLAAAGVEATETDVGEWIVQLRDETPSHMVMPAIHLNRRQVAATLRDATHTAVPDDDVSEQVAAVRTALRPRFMGTGVGITGANALVADQGAVLLVTNEGNESLLTAMVDVLVVIAGIEKLVPSLEDAMAQVRLLARSATGQVITTYTTLLAAPAEAQEMHVVLLDNGRSAMRDDPEFRDALRCIRCAACASVCPPYQVVGGQVFGHVYSGAIGLVATPFHHGLGAAAGPQSLCVSCNACQDVCPVDIPLPRQILAVRRRVAGERTGVVRRIASAVWRSPRLSGALMSAAALASAPLRRSGGTLRVPRPPRHRWRAVPAFALRPAHSTLPAQVAGATSGPLAHSAARGLRVALLTQCITDRFAPQLAHDTVRVLSACGVTVLVPPAQHCCGLPLFDSGDWDGARRMARQTIEVLESGRAPTGWSRPRRPASPWRCTSTHTSSRASRSGSSVRSRWQRAPSTSPASSTMWRSFPTARSPPRPTTIRRPTRTTRSARRAPCSTPTARRGGCCGACAASRCASCPRRRCAAGSAARRRSSHPRCRAASCSASWRTSTPPGRRRWSATTPAACCTCACRPWPAGAPPYAPRTSSR